MITRVKQYKVIFSDAYGQPDHEVLSDKVEDEIYSGWQPLGAPFAYGGGLVQAIVLFEETEE